MATVKVTGVVLRAVNYRDYDRILTLFTRERGSLTVSARGVRRTNARYRAGCQLFSAGEFLLYSKGTRYYLSQAEARGSAFELGSDPRALMHATFAANVVEAAIVREEPNEELYALFMSALALYRHPGTDPSRVTAFFLVQAMQNLGFGLQLNGCARCRAKGDGLFFSVASGGTVCRECSRHCPDAGPLPPALFDALCALSAASPRGLASMKISQQTDATVLPLLVSYAQYHLDRVFKSASLLDAFSS